MIHIETIELGCVCVCSLCVCVVCMVSEGRRNSLNLIFLRYYFLKLNKKCKYIERI